MTAKTSFRGSFTALVTPFKNGSVDEKAFRDLVEWQIAEGTRGLVPVGTTGESPTLTHDEHKDVVEWIKQGRIKYREDIVEGLEAAPEAFIGLLHGKNFGKLLVRVASEK